MKRFSKFCLYFIAAAFFTTLFSQSASALEFGARGYYWFPSLKSNMRVDGSTIRGTEFNLKDNLSLGSEGYPSVEIFAGLGKSHLSVMYTQADYNGVTTLVSPITFNGTTFNGTVASSFKIKMIDLAYKYDLIDMSNILAGFSLSAIGKLKYVEGDTSMAGSGVAASETFKIPVPMVGAAAHVGILADILEARAEVTGIGYNGNYLYEALADISLTPFPLIDIHGGYKIIGIHVDHKDVYFASDFAGPFVALTIGF